MPYISSPTAENANIVVESLNIDVFSSGTKRQDPLETGNITLRRKKGQGVGEKAPDSEEDKILKCHPQPRKVIVISSDSEQEEEEEVEAILNIKTSNVAMPGSWLSDSQEDEDLDQNPWVTDSARMVSHYSLTVETSTKRLFKTPRSGRRLPPARKIVESSESEHSESESESPVIPVKKQPVKKLLADQVIELTSSSEDEREPEPPKLMRTSQEKALQDKLPSYLTQEDGGAILIFDEPKSARKPAKVAIPKHQSTSKRLRDITGIEKAGISTSAVTAKTLIPSDSPSTSAVSIPTSRNTSRPKTAKSTTRISKKAIEEAEQAKREKYAQDLFDELNTLVFKNGLPAKTKLSWNKRLLTTAGRAKYRRSRDGVETAEIELATKILDCNERIRNTLSHEMCHLATWVIDKKLDENHGKLFKYWASRVTRKRSDIEITTRHDYEISYPYKWECQKCQKIYGRYTKSIRPDECVCGACRKGRLIPLFTVRTKAQTPKISRLAAGKTQDSPCSVSQPKKTPMALPDLEDSAHFSDVDADVEALTLTMDNTHIV